MNVGGFLVLPHPPDAARATFCHLLGWGGDGGLGRATLIGVREAKASWSPSSFPGFFFPPTEHSCQKVSEQREGVGSTQIARPS